MTEKQFTDRLLIFSIVMATIVTGVMGYYLGTREVIVPESAEMSEEGKLSDILEGVSFDESALEDVILIPLPKTVTKEDVSVRTDIIQREISIDINGIEDGYFYTHPLSGDSNHIERLLYGYESGRVLIEAKLTECLDCAYDIEEENGSNTLLINLKNPSDIYRKIVVIDPAHGGEDSGTICYEITESEINIRFAKALADALYEKDIKGILVRDSDGENISEEERKELISGVPADAVITVRCAGDARSRVTSGIYALYGGEDGELAEAVLDRIAVRTGSLNLGASRDGKLSDGCIDLYIGYLTNKAEALLLNTDDYLANMAEGVAVGMDGYFGE